MKPTNGIFSFTHHTTSVNVKDDMGLFPKLYQEHKVGIICQPVGYIYYSHP